MQTSLTIHRLDLIHPIVVNGPDVRYEFDITYLNEDMQNAFGIKFLLTIMDVFSRKAMVYGTNTKKSEVLLKNIIDFCIHNKFPSQFSSDNGPEIKNGNFNEFYIINNISYIHGVPYNPYSQGPIKRFNYTIKKYLNKEFISNTCKTLNFEEIRNKVINYYNNKLHHLLGMSPNDAYKISVPEKKKINEIKIKEYDKINKKKSYLNINDACLLNPKCIKLSKKTLIVNKVKKGKFLDKIPVRILDTASYGYYLIKISSNFNNTTLSFKSGEEYVVDSVLLKKSMKKLGKQ